jgi:hypothetical protein
MEPAPVPKSFLAMTQEKGAEHTISASSADQQQQYIQENRSKPQSTSWKARENRFAGKQGDQDTN